MTAQAAGRERARLVDLVGGELCALGLETPRLRARAGERATMPTLMGSAACAANAANPTAAASIQRADLTITRRPWRPSMTHGIPRLLSKYYGAIQRHTASPRCKLCHRKPQGVAQ